MKTNQNEPAVVVAIDGPAGAGKSTIAKALAKRLGFFYLDTGAMYRAVTVKALRAGVDLENEQALADLASKTLLDFGGDPATGLSILLDGEDVSKEIRTPEVTNQTFYIARAPRVREILVCRQQEIGRRKSVVIEGRDAGTVIFPDAQYKFYLDADFQERARRRFKELTDAGKPVLLDELSRDLQSRDQKDLTRQTGPLKKADDAVFIDSTRLDIGQVVEKIIGYILAKQDANR